VIDQFLQIALAKPKGPRSPDGRPAIDGANPNLKAPRSRRRRRDKAQVGRPDVEGPD
jgi:hypothetical protein